MKILVTMPKSGVRTVFLPGRKKLESIGEVEELRLPEISARGIEG